MNIDKITKTTIGIIGSVAAVGAGIVAAGFTKGYTEGKAMADKSSDDTEHESDE